MTAHFPGIAASAYEDARRMLRMAEEARQPRVPERSAAMDADDDCGRCEGCSKAMQPDDQVHVCMDGEILCEECAPTWGDLKSQVADSPEREDQQEVLAGIQTYVDRGGSLDDKCVHLRGL